ncbi:MAG: hypothetical protein DRN90_03965 [Thermoproteota archaeon]|nr:MAG: hypothetical protein DRN90_03965 [Candidatus Korarchaeota archaeon]
MTLKHSIFSLVLIPLRHFHRMEHRKEHWMEGDFLENLDGVIFDVKGNLHPKDSVVAFVRYVPDPKGDRRRGSRRYRKIQSLAEKMEFLRKNYPHYLVMDPVFDEEVCEVPKDEIIRFYDPKRKVQEILHSSSVDALKLKVREFVEEISSLSNVTTRCFGVSGSILVDLHTTKSDIDPIVYGSDNCYRVHETLMELHKQSGRIRSLNRGELQDLYRSKLRDTLLDPEAFLRSMEGRVMEGIFEGILYSIRFLKNPEEIEEEYGKIRFKNMGEVEIEGKVVDARESIFTPCRYVLKDVKVVIGSTPGEIREVCSYRSRFCDIAKEGSIIRARGKLEKVITREEEFLRVLVGGKRTHFMVRLS